MRSKAAPYLILAVLLVITLAVLKFRGGHEVPHRDTTQRKGQTDNRGFDRRTSFLEYTRHARCRMECRKITQAEVQDIMQNGRINYRKSDVKDRPCPTYALEGYTDDNQHVRIVFAQCDQTTKVVTCIDLEREWQCDCPGDGSKSKNR